MKLSTNAGFNAFAVLIPATTAILEMPDGWPKTTLLVIVSIGSVIVGVTTKGSGIDPERGSEMMETHESVKDLLKAGRE